MNIRRKLLLLNNLYSSVDFCRVTFESRKQYYFTKLQCYIFKTVLDHTVTTGCSLTKINKLLFSLSILYLGYMSVVEHKQFKVIGKGMSKFLLILFLHHLDQTGLRIQSKKRVLMADAKSTLCYSLDLHFSVFQNRPNRGALICLKIHFKKL